jgi:hypothetical protein
MKSAERTHFFATKLDLEPGLDRIEAKHDLQYARCGHYSKDVAEVFATWWDIPDLGLNSTGDHLGTAYLVLPKSEKVTLEKNSLKDGRTVFVLDQRLNPLSWVFRPGGKFGEEALICGHIETCSDSSKAAELRRDFAEAVVKGFERIGNYRVGPKAAELLDSGFRLVTIGVGSPREYDLRRTTIPPSKA